MKKLVIFLFSVVFVFSLSACGGMSVSEKSYEEISKYVTDNRDELSPEKEIQFFDYDVTGSDVGVYYGYYYTADNEIVVPDFYSGDDLGEKHEEDGGTYFGKPNNGTDWCYIKKITNNWYYYELHWA